MSDFDDEPRQRARRRRKETRGLSSPPALDLEEFLRKARAARPEGSVRTDPLRKRVIPRHRRAEVGGLPPSQREDRFETRPDPRSARRNTPRNRPARGPAV